MFNFLVIRKSLIRKLKFKEEVKSMAKKDVLQEMADEATGLLNEARDLTRGIRDLADKLHELAGQAKKP
ncbi:MAG: hypothetical protein KAU07_00855 [Candidatus Andersenbacteria bacterium]|nr:hypothetical protein [Candidatus Andersenbacteria bacterium]